MSKLKLDLEEVKDYYYNKKMSATEVAKIFNTGYAVINRFLKRNGCKLKSLSEIHRKFDQDVFESIDTQEKAYWLGYMFADGCVRVTNHKHINGTIYSQYSISLTSIDKEVIVAFKRFLNCNTKLKKYKVLTGYTTDSSYYIESVSSYKMFKDLEDKNCLSNKTKKLEIPKNVPQELIRHFIRGYFDGDGSVYICKTKNKSLNPYKGKSYYEKLSVNIVSTYDFCRFLNKEIFSQDSDKNVYKEKRSVQDNIYYLKFDTNKAKLFYEFIYRDSNIFLGRKKEKFDKFLEKGSTTIISNPVMD